MKIKDLERAEWIANSYDGDEITTEDIVTACMGMATFKTNEFIEFLRNNKLLNRYVTSSFIENLISQLYKIE